MLQFARPKSMCDRELRNVRSRSVTVSPRCPSIEILVIEFRGRSDAQNALFEGISGREIELGVTTSKSADGTLH